jgi:hypothetical protein
MRSLSTPSAHPESVADNNNNKIDSERIMSSP